MYYHYIPIECIMGHVYCGEEKNKQTKRDFVELHENLVRSAFISNNYLSKPEQIVFELSYHELLFYNAFWCYIKAFEDDLEERVRCRIIPVIFKHELTQEHALSAQHNDAYFKD